MEAMSVRNGGNEKMKVIMKIKKVLVFVFVRE